MYNMIEPGCFFSPFNLNLFTREMCDAIFKEKFFDSLLPDFGGGNGYVR